MCEFCIKHGEGQKWYLRAKNYSAELREKLNSIETAEKFGTNFNSLISKGEQAVQHVKKWPRPFKSLVYNLHGMWQKKTHFGQVIPIEDMEQILRMMTTVVRIPCLCRRYSRKDEGRYCLGITIDPVSDETVNRLVRGPDLTGLEYMKTDEVVNLVREFDRKGLIHTVWTVQTPYIAALCNCQMDTCTGFKFHNEGLQTIFKAEYVAVLDPDKCAGCRACIAKCPFGAIQFNDETKKVHIDPTKCYGCGLCRVPCRKGAISLMDRKDHAIAMNLW